MGIFCSGEKYIFKLLYIKKINILLVNVLVFTFVLSCHDHNIRHFHCVSHFGQKDKGGDFPFVIIVKFPAGGSESC